MMILGEKRFDYFFEGRKFFFKLLFIVRFVGYDMIIILVFRGLRIEFGLKKFYFIKGSMI